MSPEQRTKPNLQLETGWRQLQKILASTHIVLVCILLFLCSYYYPLHQIKAQQNNMSYNTLKKRQLILEALDKIIRYQRYYKKLYGRYTRDLGRLGIPNALSQGSVTETKRNYEISVLSASNNHILVMATRYPYAKSSKQDKERIIMDERFHISSSFQIPKLTQKYLISEAKRILLQQKLQLMRPMGLASKYWQVEEQIYNNNYKWIATGVSSPVLGEKIEHSIESERRPASLFSSIKSQIHYRSIGKQNKYENNELKLNEIYALLTDFRLAQFIFFQEYGRFSKEWHEIEQVSGFGFLSRIQAASNIALDDLKLTKTGYRISLKGTNGDLLGELLTINEKGSIKQIRYTDVLINELERSTKFLNNNKFFQIDKLDTFPERIPSSLDQDPSLQ